MFFGTPRAANPVNVLKKNLHQNVDNNLDNKVAGRPRNSSPYTMLSGKTEKETPVQRFVKTQKLSAETSAKVDLGISGTMSFPLIFGNELLGYSFMNLKLDC